MKTSTFVLNTARYISVHYLLQANTLCINNFLSNKHYPFVSHLEYTDVSKFRIEKKNSNAVHFTLFICLMNFDHNFGSSLTSEGYGFFLTNLTDFCNRFHITGQ